MSKLEWDQVGERRYETGVDRGVLYLGGGAVPWNGLTEVSDNSAADIKSFVQDGVKYLDHQMFGAFSGSVKAYTYPDELNAYIGDPEFAPGVVLHDQRAKTFHMAYRTKVGDDVDGLAAGYKIHILYNVQAIAGANTASTMAKDVDPQLFDWTLSAVPYPVQGMRPTAHLSLHTRGMDPELLETIEGLLYGTSIQDANLPHIVELLSLIESS